MDLLIGLMAADDAVDFEDQAEIDNVEWVEDLAELVERRLADFQLLVCFEAEEDNIQYEAFLVVVSFAVSRAQLGEGGNEVLLVHVL